MNGLINMVRGLGPLRLAAMAGVTLVLLGFFVFLVIRMGNPPMSLLYSGLDPADSGQIVARLEKANVPYRLDEGGSSILVPADQALRMRVTLAEEGMPSGGSVGYEIFDKSDSLGTTSFVQNINHLRALEGELARTIRSIEGVQTARVHLVLPQRDVFSRESRDPTAAIVVKKKVGRIDSSQVKAIQHLVAASVPGLKPNRVSVVDDRGTLLGGADSDGPGADTVSGIDEKISTFESRLRREIEELLGNSLGYDKVRAEVAAELDFDRVTTNSEEYDPDKQVVRSTQTVSENSANSDGTPKGTVSVASNLPESQQNQNGNTAPSARTERSEETVNYEISRTTRTQVHETGLVKRLSVAVLLDGNYTTAADGKRTYQPRSQAEIDQVSALVKSAIGFDEKRGDRVDVVNMAFAQSADTATSTSEANAGVMGLNKADYMKLVEIAALGLVTSLVVLLVLRPLVMRVTAESSSGMAGLFADETDGRRAEAQGALPSPGMQRQLPGPSGGNGGGLPGASAEDNQDDDMMVALANVEGSVRSSSLKRVGEFVDKHPDEAVAIVRNWMYKEA